jgi:hypothetical protein
VRAIPWLAAIRFAARSARSSVNYKGSAKCGQRANKNGAGNEARLVVSRLAKAKFVPFVTENGAYSARIVDWLPLAWRGGCY